MKRKHTEETDVAPAAVVVDQDHYHLYEEDGAGDIRPYKPSYEGIVSGDG